jgi:hypothetical protein
LRVVFLRFAFPATTVSKNELRYYAGHISDDEAMNRIETAVIAQLSLERRYPKCL